MAEALSGEDDQPSWLDSDYVEKIMQAYTQQDLGSIKSFTIAPATVKGENYASAMHLLNVQYSPKSEPGVIKNASMIVKSRLDDELMAQIEEEFNVFERETQVYKVIMKQAESLLKSIGEETRFGPRVYYVDERVIVQENLKLKGFGILDVKKGLDFEQVRIILEKLARFHAATMFLYKKDPDMFRHHLPGNVSANPTPLHDLYTNAIDTCIDFCRTSPTLKQYVPKLEDFGVRIIPKMINVFSRNQTDRFHVLNHGDVWVNNMMFARNEQGGLSDVLFVDYQEGFFGSPGIDWNYFMFSSWQLDVFENRFDDLLQIYHKVLKEILEKLQYEQRIPTLEDVRKEIINKGFHGLSTATCLLPILINEHEDLADPASFLLETPDASKKRSIIFSNPKFAARLEVYLAYFVKNNIL